MGNKRVFSEEKKNFFEKCKQLHAGSSLIFPREGLSALMCFSFSFDRKVPFKTPSCSVELYAIYLQGARAQKAGV